MNRSAIIVTIHVGSNFGSVLQTYATEYILRQLGFDAKILNYIPPRVTYSRYFKNMFNDVWRIPKKMIAFPIFVLNKYIYMGFVRRNCHLTCPYYSIGDIKKNMPKADVYITGSDQVWNSIYNEGVDEVYYFTFLPPESRIIAFSSSFGRMQLPKDEEILVRSYLSRYKYISVREKSAKAILDKMGIKDVVNLLDPTILINREIWTNNLIKRRVERNPYLLVFAPYNTVSEVLIYATATKIARKKNLKIVTFSWGVFTNKRADKTYRFASPEVFLSLMCYASCVITNSFHGTAFAINFNRPLWVYEPSDFSTRLISILDQTQLRHRLLGDVISDNLIDQEIDYKVVNEILEIERSKALGFLKKALN